MDLELGDMTLIYLSMNTLVPEEQNIEDSAASKEHLEKTDQKYLEDDKEVH